jgi:hypothetical protein
LDAGHGSIESIRTAVYPELRVPFSPAFEVHWAPELIVCAAALWYPSARLASKA